MIEKAMRDAIATMREAEQEIVTLRTQRDALAQALRDVLRLCDEIARAEYENRCSYYGSGEIGDFARSALASLEQKS